MFKNKYFVRDSRYNRKFVNGLNKLSYQSQRMEALEQEIEQLKAKNNDAKQETKTNDESESTPGKLQHEDFSDKDQHLGQEHLEREQDSSEICHFELESQDKDRTSLETNPQLDQDRLLKRSKLLIEKLFRKQSKLIAQLNSKRINNRLKLLLIESTIRKNPSKYFMTEPELWQSCEEILDQVFQLCRDQAREERENQLREFQAMAREIEEGRVGGSGGLGSSLQQLD